MPRTRTLDHKHTHKERETKIYEVRQDAYVPKAEERDLLMIYTGYKRITIDFLKNSDQISLLNPIKRVTSSIYGEEKKLPKQL